MLDAQKEWLTQSQIENQFNIRISWLWLKQVQEAIPDNWLYLIKNKTQNEEEKFIEIDKIQNNDKPSKFMYNFVIEHRTATDVSKYKNSWANKLGIEIEMSEYQDAFKRLYHISNIVKYRNFQYRLLLNKIFVNDMLKKWKKVDSEQCKYCKNKQLSICY